MKNKKPEQYAVSVKDFDDKWESTGIMIRESQYVLVQTYQCKTNFPSGLFTQRKYGNKQILLTEV